MTTYDLINMSTLQAICDVLGDSYTGFTGGEITKLLQNCGIEDIDPQKTKRERLFIALNTRQKHDGSGNNVLAFILKAMDPVSYTQKPQLFESRKNELNRALAFIGLFIGNDGKLQLREVAKTIDDATDRAGRLYRILVDRHAHVDVLRFCKAELLQENYFHAVFEATKSLADKIREKSGLTSDGSALIDNAFGGDAPILAFNKLQTGTEHSEHTGLMFLLKGIFGTFRNTLAHEPKIKWVIDEQDAIDMLQFTSFLHRRLDKCYLTNLKKA